MTAKEQLLRELEQAPEELIQAILHLLRLMQVQSSWRASHWDNVQAITDRPETGDFEVGDGKR